MKIISLRGTWNAVLLLLATPFILIVCYWGMLEWHDIQLENRTSGSKIIGRTPAQVITLLGPPHYRQHEAWEPAGTEIMIYTNGSNRICRITFENGVAKTIERLSDH